MLFDILYTIGGQTLCDIADLVVNGAFTLSCQIAALVNIPAVDFAVNCFGWFIH